ncbi:hypothetical protein JHK82_041226 [Glycine max]|nr:hypothetical protein JHK86_041290 [Glycine max]KAG4955516.1 hypothetical protein JHK85_041896 [Glycine max]KAG5104256.1 hypothetical protein JHK82_041226 [Glycine max]KAG5115385.1 hypothetical protein JHK84_041498 [Glycine max]
MKDETFLQHPFVLAVVLVLGLVMMDPFHLGPVAEHEFRPVKHSIAPYHQVMKNWPRDNMSRLALHGKSEFKNQVFGPESLEFDNMGRLRFDKESGDLYIADAYYGLLVVGPNGGLATSLATHVEGKPILFANDLDIHKNGSIFFTDTSKRYNRVAHFFILLEGEATGRLLRYDPPTKTTHVVLDGLVFPNGVQFSKDHSFLLYTETTNCRLMKLWIEGPKSGTVELLADLPGFPDNVRINEKGQFWVAIDCCRTPAQEVLSHNPWLRNIYFRLPIRMSLLARAMGMKMYTVISLLDDKGEVLEVLEDQQGQVMKLVSEVREEQGKLWIGTVAHNHIATLSYP